VQPGGLVTGQLTVTNTGAVQLLGVAVEVFLPDEIAAFAPNQTSGASATCTNNGYCLPRQRLIWTVGTLARGAGVTLTMPPHIQANVAPGTVVTFNALASEGSGFTAAARASVRVQTP
jgi:hypothetical protein